MKGIIQNSKIFQKLLLKQIALKIVPTAHPDKSYDARNPMMLWTPSTLINFALSFFISLKVMFIKNKSMKINISSPQCLQKM